MPICDGCGMDVDARHIHERIERLELATRFRPIHIQVLLLDGAPPLRMEDYFYQTAKDHSIQMRSSAQYREQLFKCAGLVPNVGVSEEALLTDFQRTGFFLAHAVECPVEGDGMFADAIHDLSATVVKRLQYSYRPKRIALLFQPGEALMSALEKGGLSDRLILERGQPFVGLDFGRRLSEAIVAIG